MHMMKRLKKEEQNLKNFETLISGGKDFADLVYSVLCLQESKTNVKNCNPFTGPSCNSQQMLTISNTASDPGNVSNNGSDPGSPYSTGSQGLTKSQKKRLRQKAKKLAEMQAENVNNNTVLGSAFVQGRRRGGYTTRRRR
jgi:peptide methionine sulfoxide reductase MsrA